MGTPAPSGLAGLEMGWGSGGRGLKSWGPSHRDRAKCQQQGELPHPCPCLASVGTTPPWEARTGDHRAPPAPSSHGGPMALMEATCRKRARHAVGTYHPLSSFLCGQGESPGKSHPVLSKGAETPGPSLSPLADKYQRRRGMPVRPTSQQAKGERGTSEARAGVAPAAPCSVAHSQSLARS